MDETLWPVKNTTNATDFTYPYVIQSLNWKDIDEDEFEELKNKSEKIIENNARFQVKNPYEIEFEKNTKF